MRTLPHCTSNASRRWVKISAHSPYVAATTNTSTVVLSCTTHVQRKQRFYPLPWFVKLISEFELCWVFSDSVHKDIPALFMHWLPRFTYNRFILLNKMNYKHLKVTRDGRGSDLSSERPDTCWVLQDNECDVARSSFPLGQRSSPSPSVSSPSKRQRYALLQQSQPNKTCVTCNLQAGGYSIFSPSWFISL